MTAMTSNQAPLPVSIALDRVFAGVGLDVGQG